jgi:hypothetical protein
MAEKSDSGDELYDAIRASGGIDTWKMNILSWSDCGVDEARAKHREYYDKHIQDGFKVLNDQVPHGCIDYYSRNRDKILEKKRMTYKPRDVKEIKSSNYKSNKTEILKKAALKRVAKTGRPPTLMTIDKHGITQDEIQAALDSYSV